MSALEGRCKVSAMVVFVCACGRRASYPRVSKTNATLPTTAAERDGWTFVRRDMCAPKPVCPECSRKDGAR